MPADSFICGDCEIVFHDIAEFVSHKKICFSGSQISSAHNETTILLEENVDTPHVKVEASNSAVGQHILIPTSNAAGTIQTNADGQQIFIPMSDAGDSGILNDIQTSQYEMTSALLQDNVTTNENKEVAVADLYGVQGVIMDDQSKVADGVNNTDGVTFSQIGDDGQTMYSYVITKDQLAQLGVQSDDGSAITGDWEQFADSSQVTVVVSSSQKREVTSSGGEAATNTTVVNASGDAQELTVHSQTESPPSQQDTSTRIRLVPVQSNNGVGTHAIVVRTAKEFEDEEAAFRNTNETVTSPTKKHRRGRPRKGEEKPKRKMVELPQPVVNRDKPPLPEPGADGRYSCAACKKAFGRVRHYNTHRCLSWDDYVDITKSDVIESNARESAEEDMDTTEDFVMPDVKANKTPAKDMQVGSVNSGTLQIVATQSQDASADQYTSDSYQFRLKGGVDSMTWALKEIKSNEDGQNSTMDGSVSSKKKKKNKIYGTPTSKVEDLPIFTTEQDKIDFDSAMNVDLSFVDELYSCHQISQDVNSGLTPPNNFRSVKAVDNLTIYTCNECKRVFMSQSHCRLHCVSHTDAKPFKCIKCDYSTNAKGHLYTHIRQHTGQMYKCPHCNFATGNKTHLVEHQETHNDTKHMCKMCKKEYSTKKSMVNHIRVYHTGEAGKAYLLEFMVRGPRNKVSVLHQCYVCNRKFKKKLDRDRHLFCHNIRDVSSSASIYTCDLCAFSTYRQSYLDKHYLRHKLVYVCAVCDEKFASTVRLNEHLTEKHDATDINSDDVNYETWKELFERCIKKSWYLKQVIHQAVVEVEKVQEGDEFHYVTKDPTKSTLNEQAATESETFYTVPQAKSLVHRKETKPGLSKLKTSKEENTDVDPDRDSITCEDKDYFSGLTLEEEQEATLNLEQALSGREETSDQVAQLRMLDEPNEEGEVDTTDPKMDIPPLEASKTVYKRLNYEALTMEIFQYVRQVYGNEECEFCGRLFFLRGEYEQHLKVHTGEKPFACEQCDFRAISKYTLRKHVQREHERVIFKCSVCEYEGTCRTQLWTHQKEMHSGIAAVCSVCGDEFSDFKLLKAHLSIKHRGLDVAEKHKMIFPSSKQQIGRRVYKCPHCAKTFLRAYADFQRHLWVHEGIKPFTCVVCAYACRSNANLKAHMLKHSSDKPFLCTVCGKPYKSRTALRWHVRSHKFGKAFKCTKCNYQALQKAHLTRHMETHYIRKAHVCQHCDFSANTLGYMKIHYTRHHKGCFYNPDQGTQFKKQTDPSAKVFKCAHCEYLFGNMGDMKRHLRTRHNMQETDVFGITEEEIITQEEIEQTEIMTADCSPAIQENVVTANNITILPEFKIKSASGEIIRVKRIFGDGDSIVLSPIPVSLTPNQHASETKTVTNTTKVSDNRNGVSMEMTTQDVNTTEEMEIDIEEQSSGSVNHARIANTETQVLSDNNQQYLVDSNEALTSQQYNDNVLVVKYISEDGVLEVGDGDTNLILTHCEQTVSQTGVGPKIAVLNTNLSVPVTVQNTQVFVQNEVQSTNSSIQDVAIAVQDLPCTSVQHTNTPVSSIYVPLQNINTPMQSIHVPPQNINTPMQSTHVPQQSISTPMQSTPVPQQSINTPVQSAAVPQQNINTPVQSAAVPQQSINTPVQSAAVLVQNTNNQPQTVDTEAVESQTPADVVHLERGDTTSSVQTTITFVNELN